MNLRQLADRLARLKASIPKPVTAPSFCVQAIEPARDGHPTRVTSRIFIPSRVREAVTEYGADRCTPVAWRPVENTKSAAIEPAPPTEKAKRRPSKRNQSATKLTG